MIQEDFTYLSISIIPASIVYKNDLEIWIISFQQIIHRAHGIDFFIKSRNNYAHQWCFTPGRGPYRTKGQFFFPDILSTRYECEENDSACRKDDKKNKEGYQKMTPQIGDHGQIIIKLQQIITAAFGNGRHQVIFFLAQQVGNGGELETSFLKIMYNLRQRLHCGCTAFTSRIMQ